MGETLFQTRRGHHRTILLHICICKSHGKRQWLVQPLFCIDDNGSCQHETLQPRIMFHQWPSAYLLYVKRAAIAIQLDPTAASAHIQLFLLSIIVVTLRLVTCRFVCAAPITRVNKPERHLRVLRPCTLGVSKEVSASFDPARVCFLALFTDQAQLVRVWTTHCAVGSTWGLFTAVENLGIIFVMFGWVWCWQSQTTCLSK